MVTLTEIVTQAQLACDFSEFASVAPSSLSYWATSLVRTIRASALVSRHPAGMNVISKADVDAGCLRPFCEGEMSAFHAPHRLEALGLPVIVMFFCSLGG